jgi:hypothetical protein
MSTKRYFFITGLPRSKSAWLANYLTWGDSFCYHDQLQHFTHLHDFRTMLTDTPAAVVGHSDPANVLVWRDLAAMFPDATWIVVRRNFGDCLRACRRINPDTLGERLNEMQTELDRLCTALKPVELAFDQSYLGEAAAVALGLPLNQARAKFLEHLQVQVEPVYLRDRINQFQLIATT